MFYKRLLYLAYYLKELDKMKFQKFLDHIQKVEGKSKSSLLLDIVISSLIYNISILEYFQFHFYKLPPEERKKFAGTGFMYEYQLKMNPKAGRRVLENKLDFLRFYVSHIRHDYASLIDLKKDHSVAERVLSNKSGKVVLKSTSGQCGRGVEVRDSSEFTPSTLIQRLEETGNDFVEEFVSQHQDLMKLSPSGLNTVRIITQLNQYDQVEIVGARLRITVNSSVDNMAAGNIAAPINIENGVVEGPGVYSDITKEPELVHPVTKVPIVNFKIPFWQGCLKMVKDAALLNKRNRSIGWDVAVTDEGPELIEGNHDWCKLLWQLPVQKGLKPELEKYLIKKL
jgi:hypothetical protein